MYAVSKYVLHAVAVAMSATRAVCVVDPGAVLTDLNEEWWWGWRCLMGVVLRVGGAGGTAEEAARGTVLAVERVLKGGKGEKKDMAPYLFGGRGRVVEWSVAGGGLTEAELARVMKA